MGSGLIKPGDNFRQNGYGTCQSLAVVNGILRAQVDSIMHVPGGAKHLDDMITKSGNDGWNVNFPGRTPVQVLRSELEQDHRLLGSGSLGLQILEKATTKVHEKEKIVPDPYRLYMGEQGDSYLLFTNSDLGGKQAENIASSRMAANLMQQVYENKAVMVGSTQRKGVATTIDGEKVNMPFPHAYTLFMNDKQQIQFENPHDTSKKYTISVEEAKKTFEFIFVGNTPNHTITAPKELAPAMEKSKVLAQSLHQLWKADGAYSIEDKPGARANAQDSKKFFQAYDEYYSSLEKADELIRKQMPQAERDIKAGQRIKDDPAVRVGKDTETSLQKVAGQIVADKKAEAFKDVLNNNFFKSIGSDKNPGREVRAKEWETRGTAKDLFSAAERNGVISADSRKLLHAEVDKAKTVGDFQKLGANLLIEIENKEKGIVTKQNGDTKGKSASLDTKSLDQAKALMDGIGAKPEHLGRQLAGGTSVAAPHSHILPDPSEGRGTPA